MVYSTPPHLHSGIHNESACHTQSIICKDPPPGCYGNSRSRRERWPVQGGGPRKGDSRNGGPGGWQGEEADTLGNLYNYPQERRKRVGEAGWLFPRGRRGHTHRSGEPPRARRSFVISQSYCHPSATTSTLLLSARQLLHACSGSARRMFMPCIRTTLSSPMPRQGIRYYPYVERSWIAFKGEEFLHGERALDAEIAQKGILDRM